MDIRFGPGFFERDRYNSPPREITNLFPEAAPNQDDREFVLLPTPGLTAYKDLSGTLTRGIGTSYDQFNNDLFVVYDNQFKRITPGGTVGSNITVTQPASPGGNIANDSKPVDMAFSAIAEMAFTSGGKFYVYDGTDLYDMEAHDADLTDLNWVNVVYLAGRFVIAPDNDDQFWWTDVLDGKSIDALAFATAERKGSNIRAMTELNGDLWIFEQDNIEIWGVTGRSDLPFQLRTGGIIDKGIVGSWAHTRVGQSLFWVGDDRVVYRAEGAGAAPVSTPAISEILQGVSQANARLITAYSYIDDGHQFVVFNIPAAESLGCGLVYDTTTNEWHKRLSNLTLVGGVTPGYVPWDYVWWNNDHYVAARYDAALYRLDKTKYLEESVDGNTDYEVSRQATMFVPVRSLTPCYNFTVDCTKGVGDGDDPNPVVYLSWSDDGGQSYFPEPPSLGRPLSLGASGDYSTRVTTTRLGQIKPPGRVFKLRFTDKTLYALYGARVNEANP